MNVQSLGVTQAQAAAALREYKAHRGSYDKKDWEIERIYRQIARGNQVISAFEAIRRAGVDEHGRPRLAIMRADQAWVRCEAHSSLGVTFRNLHGSKAVEWYFPIPWPARPTLWQPYRNGELTARLPRIPPQHRPQKNLGKYHILWEADWQAIPRDPYLLYRIAKDAWVVLAGWELTDVEVSVLRAHQ